MFKESLINKLSQISWNKVSKIRALVMPKPENPWVKDTNRCMEYYKIPLPSNGNGLSSKYFQYSSKKKKKKDSVISEKKKNYWVTWCLHWWDRKQWDDSFGFRPIFILMNRMAWKNWNLFCPSFPLWPCVMGTTQGKLRESILPRHQLWDPHWTRLSSQGGGKEKPALMGSWEQCKLFIFY